MNIIEAVQAAERGKLITNGILKIGNCFLRYMGNGVFYEYRTVNKVVRYRHEARNFTTSDVLSTDWEVLSENPFKQK